MLPAIVHEILEQAALNSWSQYSTSWSGSESGVQRVQQVNPQPTVSSYTHTRKYDLNNNILDVMADSSH